MSEMSEIVDVEEDSSIEPPFYNRFKSKYNNLAWKDLSKHHKNAFRSYLEKSLSELPRYWDKFQPPNTNPEQFYSLSDTEKLNMVAYLENLQDRSQKDDLPIPKRWLNKAEGRTVQKWKEAPLTLQTQWTDDMKESNGYDVRNNDLLSRVETIQKNVIEINAAFEAIPTISNNNLTHHLVLLDITNVSDFSINGGRKTKQDVLRDKTKLVVIGPADHDKIVYSLQIATVGLLNLLEVDPNFHSKYDYSLYTEIDELLEDIHAHVAARKRNFVLADTLEDSASQIESQLNSPN